MIGRDDQVSRASAKLEAAAERQTVDGRDDWLADIEELGKTSEPTGGVLRRRRPRPRRRP